MVSRETNKCGYTKLQVGGYLYAVRTTPAPNSNSETIMVPQQRGRTSLNATPPYLRNGESWMTMAPNHVPTVCQRPCRFCIAAGHCYVSGGSDIEDSLHARARGRKMIAEGDILCQGLQTREYEC